MNSILALINLAFAAINTAFFVADPTRWYSAATAVFAFGAAIIMAVWSKND